MQRRKRYCWGDLEKGYIVRLSQHNRKHIPAHTSSLKTMKDAHACKHLTYLRKYLRKYPCTTAQTGAQWRAQPHAQPHAQSHTRTHKCQAPVRTGAHYQRTPHAIAHVSTDLGLP